VGTENRYSPRSFSTSTTRHDPQALTYVSPAQN
jgi:hypothetical protein